MLLNQVLTSAAVLATAASASPLHQGRRRQNNAGGCKRTITAEALVKLAPASATCDPDATFADECRTAEQAAPFITDALDRFNVTDPMEIAALLSLMAFETGDFKFNRNHFPEPGRPGQGTRNLQMPGFNLLYALDIPEVRDQAISIATDGGSDAAAVPDGDTLSDDQKNQILDLVLPDDFTWGSAAWFLTTQCDASVREALAVGDEAGLTAYLVDCVGTEPAQERKDAFALAKSAFGLA